MALRVAGAPRRRGPPRTAPTSFRADKVIVGKVGNTQPQRKRQERPTNLARAVQGCEHEAPGVRGEGLRRVSTDKEEARDHETL